MKSNAHSRPRRAGLDLLWLSIALGAATLACSSGPEVAAEAPVYQAVVRSQKYAIDAVYKSMKGPQARYGFRLAKGEDPELLWITGYSTKIIDADTGEETSDEFMCHSNLGFKDVRGHKEIFGRDRPGRRRMFTLSQGQMEMRFPTGFGIPVLSTEMLILDSQVLNLNPQEQTVHVRHETTVDYVRDADATAMRPLFQVAAQAMVLTEGDSPYYGIDDPDPEVHGPGCMVALSAGDLEYHDGKDQTFVGHWVVPPGRQINRTNVSGWMSLTQDTRIHAIATHLHPFAVSIALRDLTTGETVYESYARESAGRIGLDHVDWYSSAEGIPIFKDHQYEVVSVYENTSEEDQDAMAILYLYMLDEGFEKPDLEALVRASSAKRAAAKTSGEAEGA